MRSEVRPHETRDREARTREAHEASAQEVTALARRFIRVKWPTAGKAMLT